MPQPQSAHGHAAVANGTNPAAADTALPPTPTFTVQNHHSPSPEPCRASPRPKHAPLLTLSPSVIPDVHEQPREEDISVIWNVISRTADVVKDGDRLENLAWRHWGAAPRRRRSSSATNLTESSTSVATSDSSCIPRSHSGRSFNSKLALLVKDTQFKDWVGDAVKNQAPRTAAPRPSTSPSSPTAPALVAPDTPVANLEIRLVEPTPVPSRVGSLGGSASLSSHISPLSKPNVVEENITEESEPAAPRTRRNNRFFIQSSPGKVSGSSSSPPSSIPRVAEQPATSLRSSGDSSSAIVIKKKERRHVSMANMAGRFAGEKARAAQAIAARKQPAEEDEDEESEWEDEEDGDEIDDEEGDDDEDWEDEPSTVDKPPAAAPARAPRVPPPAPTPPKTKKERAAEKARIEAQRDAQRKREMFAKQAVFNAPCASEGLLTRTFRTGKSMIDLTQAGQDYESDHGLRRAPTAAQLTTLSSSPIVTPLLRTKSAAAMPVETGVSVTSHHLGSAASDEQHGERDSLRGPGPDGVEMETDTEDEDDDYMQSEEMRAKIEALAAKRAERERAKTLPQPVAAPSPSSDLDPNGIVRPLSPTSRRRAIIMREMSESLRKNIIIEREKSSGRPPNMGGPHKRPPPSVHMSRLPTSSSAVNLAAQQHVGEPLQRHRSNRVHEPEFRHPHHYADTHGGPAQGQIERHNSHPNLTTMHHHTSPPPPPPPPPNNASPNAASVSPEHRRRTNVLGSGFLRPLTRVEGGIGRTHSAAALTALAVTSPTSEDGVSSHSSGTAASGSGGNRSASGHLQRLAAAPMQRSSTEGGKDAERARLRRELAKRGDESDTSYRFHGW